MAGCPDFLLLYVPEVLSQKHFEKCSDCLGSRCFDLAIVHSPVQLAFGGSHKGGSGGSADDVVQAQKGGANRVELNSCLFHGGLTPSVGELIAAKEAADLPIMAMVRPRQGGFCYTDAEYRTALADAEQLLAHGADVRAIQEMLGHADVGTTQVYTHVDARRFIEIHKLHPRHERGGDA